MASVQRRGVMMCFMTLMESLEALTRDKVTGVSYADVQINISDLTSIMY